MFRFLFTIKNILYIIKQFFTNNRFMIALYNFFLFVLKSFQTNFADR